MNYLGKQSGFTLVELIVAIGLFGLVMVVATTSLLNVVSANRKAQSFKSVMNSVNFAVESMARTMRVGTTYHCGSTSNVHTPRNCPSGSHYIAFEAADGDPSDNADQIVYWHNSATGEIMRSEQSGIVGTFVAVTPPEVFVENLTFYARDTLSVETAQPSVLIIANGYVELDEKTRTDFDLQTFVSQRLLKR